MLRAAVQEHADPGRSRSPRLGGSKNQTCKDEGPLTLERSKTVDEEISAKVVDFLDRNDPRRTNKPFFVWYNPARMHITTVFSPKYWRCWVRKAAKTGASRKLA